MNRIIYILIICLTWLNICFSENYKSYKLQDYEICDKKLFKRITEFVSPAELKLSYTKPINITQIWDFTNLRSFNLNCNFRVKTDSNYNGIYVVITKLNFRKNEETNSCIDYIEFTKGLQNSSGKICDNYGHGNNLDKIYFDIKRMDEIRIKVYINEKFILNERLEMNLYITAHGECGIQGYQCEPNHIYSCIYKDLVSDSVPNCPINCSDEDSCIYSENIKKKSTESVPIDYSHVVISAITSLLFTMFAVGTIIYTCWKYWDVCHSRPLEHRQSNHDLPIVELPETIFNGSITMSAQEDRPPSPKDLPPSYESLFPES